MIQKIEKGKINLGIRFKVIASFVVILILLFSAQGCSKSNQKIKIDTEYKAVFLDNGQVFFGRLEDAGPSYLLLRDIFYVQSQVVQQEKDKKEVKSILIKRGNEWHGPDLMYVTKQHIVVIEPVSPNSRVAQLIKEVSAKKP